MKTRSLYILIICIFIILPSISYASEPQEKPLRPFQLSIFPMIGTDGTRSLENRYELSINIFAGITGGTQGLELGGFANINRGSLSGLQVAGFANIVTQNVQGIQASGFVNIGAGDYHGLGFAGFANITGGNTQGIFGSGFANLTAGDLRGMQLSGFMNMTRDLQGLQAAGFMNMARDVQGFQAAGFMNMARDIQGFQAAGFLNMAREVKGFQIGFINMADTISGTPIGFLSIVKRGGYRRLEIAASDAFFLNASFKIGVRQFYNIFSMGVRPFADVSLAGFGYGIGTEIILSPESFLNIEAHTSQPSNFRFSGEKPVNQLSELRATFSVAVSDRMNVFAGPVLYNQVIQEDPLTGIDGLSVAPYHFFTTTFRDYYSQWWIGARAGLNVRLN